MAATRESNGERIRTIFTRLINACWSILKYGLLLGGLAVLAVVFGSWYFQNTINDKIRARVEETIAEGYPDLSVKVESVQRVEGKGILVRGLSLTEKEASGPQTELAYFQEMLLGCRAQLQQLITEKIHITHIVLRRPTLRGPRRADGAWSLQKLFPLPKFGGTAQAIRIEQGELILFDPLKNPSGILKVSDVNFLVKFAEKPDQSGNLEKWTTFKGSLLGEHFGRGEIEGSVVSKRTDGNSPADSITLRSLRNYSKIFPVTLPSISHQSASCAVNSACSFKYQTIPSVPNRSSLQPPAISRVADSKIRASPTRSPISRPSFALTNEAFASNMQPHAAGGLSSRLRGKSKVTDPTHTSSAKEVQSISRSMTR